MNMLDWPAFLTQNNIEFVTAGRYHVTKDNIAINCCWCPNDTSYNLHISLLGKGFHCFRVDSHKGPTPQRLIQKLLNCSRAYADTLVEGSGTPLPADRDFLSSLSDLFQPERAEPIRPPEILRLPKTFQPIRPAGSGRMFVSYLERRGFSPTYVYDLFKRYDLVACADGGQWHGRIVFPVTMGGRLVTWTGRHIGGHPMRYLTLSVADTATPALSPIKETVLWFDRLKKMSGTLVVCEGPFDALKINYLGADYGVHGTCLFGKSMTDAQAELLSGLDNFARKIVLLDRSMVDHWNPRGRFAALEGAGFEMRFLPQEVADPGEFTPETFDPVFGIDRSG
jgi:hypothetical protein